MLEVTVDTVDGVRFVKNVKIMEHDEKYMGVPAHRIKDDLDPEIMRFVKSMGFRRVATAEFYYNTSLYASYPINYFLAIIAATLFKGYWATIKWLYNNARFFKQIPEGDCFSWRYFTPYCWYLAAKRKF